jgi:hypothetical protein
VKWIWNDEFGGDVLLTNGGTSVTNISDVDEGYGEFFCIVDGAEPCERFSVRIDNRGEMNMQVGVWGRNPSVRSDKSNEYLLCVDDGTLKGGKVGSSEMAKEYTTPVSDGDVITLIREGSKIFFKKNGVSLGEAFNNVPKNIVLYPCVIFDELHQQITSLPTPLF